MIKLKPPILLYFDILLSIIGMPIKLCRRMGKAGKYGEAFLCIIHNFFPEKKACRPAQTQRGRTSRKTVAAQIRQRKSALRGGLSKQASLYHRLGVQGPAQNKATRCCSQHGCFASRIRRYPVLSLSAPLGAVIPYRHDPKGSHAAITSRQVNRNHCTILYDTVRMIVNIILTVPTHKIVSEAHHKTYFYNTVSSCAAPHLRC